MSEWGVRSIAVLAATGKWPAARRAKVPGTVSSTFDDFLSYEYNATETERKQGRIAELFGVLPCEP